MIFGYCFFHSFYPKQGHLGGFGYGIEVGFLLMHQEAGGGGCSFDQVKH